MKIISTIIDGASSEDVKIVTLLRQCLILASKLKNDSLKAWATAELNGYPDHDALPQYRVATITAKGFFLGPMGAQINDQPLPAVVLDERYQHWATTAYLSEPIAAYERLAADPEKDGCAISNWPADLTTRYQTKFFRDYALNRAWQEIPMGTIAGIVDTVKTRILQFTLEIQEESGGEDSDEIPEPQKIEKAVQNIIFNGTNIINSNVGDHAQFGGWRTVVEGDFHSLDKNLSDVGLPARLIDDLKKAIEEDSAEDAPKGFGKRVAGWLQSATKSAASEGGKAASSAASEAITKAVLAYFGLG